MQDEDGRVFKDGLYKQFERIGKALSSARRLELLDLLSQGERTVEELARLADLSVANTSQHLRHLYNSRLVEVRRQGQYAYYRLADEGILKLWDEVKRVAQDRLKDIEPVVSSYFGAPRPDQIAGLDEVHSRINDSGLRVVDVRPHEEYRAGRIRRSLSIPLEELEARLSELPREAELIVCGRNSYCDLARDAMQVLKRHRYKVRRLEGGLPDWKLRGLPVTRSLRGA
jgi:DNA-binding transcriptional ArsR family regulator/rhodanese-related sulfurtransferase